jgi:hypothetical protein
MSKDELIKELAATFGKMKVDKLVVILKERKFALRDLIDLTFHHDKTIAYRSAWLLENLFLIDPTSYLTDLDYLLDQFKNVKYESCQRHYTKIMMHLTSPKSPVEIKEKLAIIDLEPIVEQCFDWMIDPKVLIAVKVFASETLFNLHQRYPWIKEELTNQLEFLMRNGSPAIQTRGKKLLSKLSPSRSPPQGET